MRDFNDDEILKRVSQLDTFKGWIPGIYSIWIRSKADIYDRFDDKNFLYEVKGPNMMPAFIMKRDGTTNSGSYGLQHFKDYNPDGCAVLKSNYMVYGSHVKGFHKRNKSNPAYIQARVWPYYRDGNKNERAEEIGPIHYDIIGANDHRAGIDSQFIKNWSVACLVTKVLAQYVAFLRFMETRHYPALNTAILEEWAFDAPPMKSAVVSMPDIPPPTPVGKTETLVSGSTEAQVLSVDKSLPANIGLKDFLKADLGSSNKPEISGPVSSNIFFKLIEKIIGFIRSLAK